MPLVTWHKDEIGDKHSYTHPNHFFRELAESLDNKVDKQNMQEVMNVVRIFAVVIPVYLGETGLTTERVPGEQIGYIYNTKRNLLNKTNKKLSELFKNRVPKLGEIIEINNGTVGTVLRVNKAQKTMTVITDMGLLIKTALKVKPGKAVEILRKELEEYNKNLNKV